MIRRVCLGVALVAALVVPASAASAHVHGITPLLRCGGDLSVTGANRTDTTPAAAANGGPITGLIPRDVGNAPLTVGDGGFDAPANCPQ
ncbi:MAG TPA: hypothetical protein VF235_02695 [Actinomycetota bacterium]